MQELDLSIDEAKAKIWIDDVNAELTEVRRLLKKVNTANTEVAGSEDTIMQGIYNVGTAMGDVWDSMCNQFEKAQDYVEESIGKLGKAVVGIIEHLDEIRKKF